MRRGMASGNRSQRRISTAEATWALPASTASNVEHVITRKTLI
ncbi:hypothetical protein ALO82_102563 [Pseudomonas syringae pv. broussonetiae]|uniref:Uncharacterized protein n=1 Tax=Pseudomonas amygdali pv. dendropanacis TaxID=235272 RepID=A0A0P9P455_PSEA0|nr:hypothetical protein ALO82_102563 [Pseudomonas syringae pv. broussonetiae]KPX12547.1 hypothetical protein ALO71_102517 [Pseudomonas amygdali pv. dendropanacis]RMO31685.1 hypothetical protein ALQ43_102813 [Pseudomonas savastanoi pv. glycinea]RMT52853.1 hypothetical protein ALP47_102754 [Pseudomonas savastanoi]